MWVLARKDGVVPYRRLGMVKCLVDDAIRQLMSGKEAAVVIRWQTTFIKISLLQALIGDSPQLIL